jgi:hypothetical protein
MGQEIALLVTDFSSYHFRLPHWEAPKVKPKRKVGCELAFSWHQVPFQSNATDDERERMRGDGKTGWPCQDVIILSNVCVHFPARPGSLRTMGQS